MKYLSLFILTLFTIFFMLDCSYSETSTLTNILKGKKAKSKSKKGKSKKGKEKVKYVKKCHNECRKDLGYKLPLKPLKMTAGDMMVCPSGKNLGLVDIGHTCQSMYPKICKEVIIKKPFIPNKSKIKKIKDAKKNLVYHKPKKHWTLKGRYAKFHPKKKLTPKEKQRRLKLKLQKMKNNKLRKWAINAVNKKYLSKRVSKKTLQRNAKNMVSNVLAGNMNSVKRSLNLKTDKQKRKQKKLKKKKLPEKGRFCVQAVVMNLSYCCEFRKRSYAQKMANDQLAQPMFKKQVRKGWVAKVKERERAAAQKIRLQAKALKMFNILKHKKGMAQKMAHKKFWDNLKLPQV